ncbi:MAG: rRNA maturation RNase YbeY [Ruminococcaceae bacterium]|nr:rRNA maturation RNase YbeY [Oscillospiraceae bacterium]
MNKITFQYDNDDIISVGDNITQAIEKAVNRVLSDCKVETDCDIAVTFTDNEGIREINNNYRGIDSETDVLSFPMLEYEKPGAIFASPDDFEDGKLVLGDIVISVQKAKAQAEEYGHSEEREFAFLAAHSTLHLLGYDHMKEDEEKIMFEKQEKALTAIGLTR